MNPFQTDSARSLAKGWLSQAVAVHSFLVYSLGLFLLRLLGLQRVPVMPDPSQAKRIVVVRLDVLGDMVMTTPFLRELRRLYPRAKITLIVQPPLRNLLEKCPYIDVVETYRPTNLLWLRPIVLPLQALWVGLTRLASRGFDLAILPRSETDSYYATFLAFFSGARCRVGFSEATTPDKSRLNRGFDRFLTHVLHHPMNRHGVEHNLEIIRFLGGTIEDTRLEVWEGLEDDRRAQDLLGALETNDERPLIALGPSRGHSPLKQWPVERFIELGRRLQDNYQARIIVVGGVHEAAVGRKICGSLGQNAINGMGKTTLRELVAVLRRCRLFVGNDTGSLHVAAAAGTPCLALFGSSCPHRYGPWGQGHFVIWSELPCSPCHQAEHLFRCTRCIFDSPHCMLGITVEKVQEAAGLMLANGVQLDARNQHIVTRV